MSMLNEAAIDDASDDALVEAFDPPELPAPRAPAVLEHLEASQRSLVDLDAQIAETALAALEGGSVAQANLVDLRAKITAAKFDIESNGAAHALALRLDKQAIADWKASIQAMPPEQIVAGITCDRCCGLCRTDACVISGAGWCGHPVKTGGLNPAQQSNPAVMRVYRAARKELEQ